MGVFIYTFAKKQRLGLLLLLWLVLGGQMASAQLFQYSLYKFTPLSLNPALVAADDDKDASLIFRNQRVGNEAGIRSTQLNMTHPFISKSRGRWGGIGIQLSDDRAGESFFFKRNTAALSLAYNFYLNQHHTLSLGLSGEYERKAISTDGWRTGSQWTGSRYDGSMGTGESFDNLSSNSVNYHTGFYYSATDKNGTERFYTGFSILYINEPFEKFLLDSQLPSTFLVHSGARVFDNGEWSITPQVLWTNRASHNFINVGTKVSYQLAGLKTNILKNEGSLDLGVSYVNQKAVVLGITINQPTYNLGFSYDIDFNPVSGVSGFRGAPEIALRVFQPLENSFKKKKIKKAKKKKAKKKKKTKKKKKKKKKKPAKKKKSKKKIKVQPEEKVETLRQPGLVELLNPVVTTLWPKEAIAPISGLAPSLEMELFRKRNLYFEFNKTDISARQEEVVFLEKLIRFLNTNPLYMVRVVGHTDHIGSEEDNRILSFQRAYTVAKFLSERGIDKDRILMEGHGELNPLLPDTSDGARRVNRRVEVRLIKLEN